jgi:hypothetical protein
MIGYYVSRIISQPCVNLLGVVNFKWSRSSQTKLLNSVGRMRGVHMNETWFSRTVSSNIQIPSPYNNSVLIVFLGKIDMNGAYISAVFMHLIRVQRLPLSADIGAATFLRYFLCSISIYP